MHNFVAILVVQILFGSIFVFNGPVFILIREGSQNGIVQLLNSKPIWKKKIFN